MKRLLLQALSMSLVRRPSNLRREDRESRQDRRLRHLVLHAYRHVPYYRRLFDRHGLRPETIQGRCDLERIPITSRRDLQSLPDGEVLSRGSDPARMLTFRTSGSSGMPLTIRRAPLEQLVLRSLYMRAMRDLGLKFSSSIAVVASGHTTDPRRHPLTWRLFQTLDPRRRALVDALLPQERIRRLLRRFRPDVIVGYAGTLARVAEALTPEDRRLIRPRFLKADSEVLTPLMRAQIARGFGAQVYEMYDSHEFFTLAWECPATGELHVCGDGLILEVLKDGRPCAEGERGEVVATGLHSYAMPFIRYRLGDIVTQGSATCRCGRPFATIRSVQGRMIDHFPLPDGRLLHPYELVRVLGAQAAGWIGQYQLTQERKDRVVLRLVPRSAPPPDGPARLQSALKSVLGPDVALEVLLVPGIDVEASGKFRVSRSLIVSGYDGISWKSDGAVPPSAGSPQ